MSVNSILKEFQMAIHFGDNNTTTPDMSNTSNIPGNTATTAASSGIAAGGSTSSKADSFEHSITYDVGNSFFISATRGSEYTNTISTALEKYYNSLKLEIKPTLHVFDKESIVQLAYSVIVASIVKDNKLWYYIVVLEATGRKPLLAKDIVTYISRQNNNTNINQSVNRELTVYVTDDAVNQYLVQLVLNVLGKANPDLLVEGNNPYANFMGVDGVVLSHHNTHVDEFVYNLGANIYNALIGEYKLTVGGYKDLNLATATVTRDVNGNLVKDTSKYLELDPVFSHATVLDELGSPVRASWALSLDIASKNNTIRDLNTPNIRKNLTKVYGFVDAIPKEVITPSPTGLGQIKYTRFMPHIVITNNYIQEKSIGYMLLSLITSTVMIQRNMWLAAFRPTDAKTQPGILNIIANLENNQNGVGNIIDLTTKELTPDEVNAQISLMFSLAPVISIDVPVFGPQTFYTSILSLAAAPDGTPDVAQARKHLIDSLHDLTDTNFPKDYPITDIFVNEGVVVPLGNYATKEGLKDIRDIDLIRVLTETNGNIQLANKYILSNLTSHVSGIDPWIARVEVISKIVPDAEITGKANRLTFSANFINTMLSAAAKAGLNLQYEPAIRVLENNNLGVVGDYFGNAGISNFSNGVMRERAQGGVVYTTSYGRAGYGRYGY